MKIIIESYYQLATEIKIGVRITRHKTWKNKDTRPIKIQIVSGYYTTKDTRLLSKSAKVQTNFLIMMRSRDELLSDKKAEKFMVSVFLI